MKFKIGSACAAAIISTMSFISSLTSAQTVLQPPVISVIDNNGVNLANGQITRPSPSVSIGGNGSGLSRTADETSDNYSDTAYINPFNTYLVMYVSYGGRVYRFFIGSAYPYSINSGPYNSQGESHAQLSCNGPGGTINGSICTLTLEDGTKVDYYNSLRAQTLPVGGSWGSATTITKPDGEVDSLSYYLDSSGYVKALKTVSSTLGWMLKYEVDSFYATTKVTAINTAQTYCDPNASSCSVSSSYPYATSSTSGGTTTVQLNGQTIGSYSGTAPVIVTSPTGVTRTYQIASGKVSQVTTGGSTWDYAYTTDSSGNVTATVTEPAIGGVRKTHSAVISPKQLVLSVTDEDGKKTAYGYDDAYRIWTETHYDPSGNVTGENDYDYMYLNNNPSLAVRDDRNLITKITKIPAGGGAGLVVAQATYSSTCDGTNYKYCNKPLTVTDANGVMTTYTYDANTGNVATESKPAVGGVSAQTRYTYAQYTPYVLNSSGVPVAQSPVWRLSTTSTCMTGATCSGTSDELKTTYAYGTYNLQPTQVTVTHGNPVENTIASTTSTSTYDNNGHLIVKDGPLPGAIDEVYYFYDSLGRQTGILGVDPDGAGSLKRQASLIVYNASSQIINSESGVAGTGSTAAYSGGTATARWAQAQTDWSGMSVLQNDTTDYSTSTGLPIVTRHYDGGALHYLTQTSYDPLFRVDCTAHRLNTSIFATVTATAACSPATAGPDGDDRVVHFTYDAVGNVLNQVSAYGTSVASTDFSKTYNTATGTLASVSDGRGNKTSYSYDGYNRLTKTCYPLASSGGTSSTTDCEQIVYSGATIYQRILRDAQAITYSYDALSRVSSTSGAISASFTYNNFGNVHTVTQNGVSETYAYDTLGMVLSDAQPVGTVGYQYDAYGRRTQLNYPGGLNIDYTYDNASDLATIAEHGGTTLASYDYDNYNHITNVAYGNGYSTALGFDANQRLHTLTNSMSGTSNVITLGYSAADQINSRTQSNSGFEPPSPSVGTTSSSYNGLNQASVVGGAGFTYDGRGNLTSDGSITYAYNASNLMTNTSAGVSLTYDALDRLRSTSSPSSTTRQFLYDGTDLIAEYDTSGNVVRRYVHGQGEDNPIVWYEGSGTATKYYFQADERGSITDVTDSSGLVQTIYSYDAFGVPHTNSGSLVSRFGYTGQVWVPEIGMYYYKARIYAPTLGRFLQTDPIGYGAGMNWYAYVHGDPINDSDTSGLCPGCTGYWDGDPLDSNIPGSMYEGQNGEGSTYDISGPWGCSYSADGHCSVSANDIDALGGDVCTIFGACDRGYSGFDSFGMGGNGAQFVLREKTQKEECSSGEESDFSNAVDRVANVHDGIFTGGAAAFKNAGEAETAETLSRVGTPLSVGLIGLSEGYAAIQDHAHGMSWKRSGAIHGAGAIASWGGGEGGATIGFAVGEAIFPPGGGIVGAIVGGGLGGYLGSKAGEWAGNQAATAFGICH